MTIEISKKVCDKLGLDSSLPLRKAIRGKSGYTVLELVTALLNNNTILTAATSLGYSVNPLKQDIQKYLTPLFIGRTKSFFVGGSNTSWRYLLANCIDMQYCGKCNTCLPYTSYSSNRSNANNLECYCKKCTLVESKKHKHYIVERTPSWSNLEEISKFYSNCPVGYEVDHILPLRGKNVSGLHVLENLQYLLTEINRQKSNKYEDMA